MTLLDGWDLKYADSVRSYGQTPQEKDNSSNNETVCHKGLYNLLWVIISILDCKQKPTGNPCIAALSSYAG